MANGSFGVVVAEWVRALSLGRAVPKCGGSNLPELPRDVKRAVCLKHQGTILKKRHAS